MHTTWPWWATIFPQCILSSTMSDLSNAKTGPWTRCCWWCWWWPLSLCTNVGLRFRLCLRRGLSVFACVASVFWFSVRNDIVANGSKVLCARYLTAQTPKLCDTAMVLWLLVLLLLLLVLRCAASNKLPHTRHSGMQMVTVRMARAIIWYHIIYIKRHSNSSSSIIVSNSRGINERHTPN